MRWETPFVFLALVLVPWVSAGEPLGYPDWQALQHVEVIDIVTTDADGDVRTTPVWFVLIDGEPYLRTSASRWLENLRRQPEHRLVIEDQEYAARAEVVEGDALVARVDAASLEKYGWQERFIHVFRMRTPDLLRLSPAQ